MGSLYEPNDTNMTPDPCDFLISFDLNITAGTVTANVTSNETRAKIVLEDTSVKDSSTSCEVVIDPTIGTCWDPCECPGQYNKGDANCDGKVNITDVIKVKQSWLKSCGQDGYNCCADFNHDEKVNITDIIKLKQNWLASGLGGTSNTTCADPNDLCP
jgi:hypothetical protein